jgi:hypothetical protein
MEGQSSSGSRSRFLDLPAEVREVIYKLLFAGSILQKHDRMGRRNKWDTTKSQHLILFTCRQVYQEACQLFYQSTIWHFHKPCQVFYHPANWNFYKRSDGAIVAADNFWEQRRGKQQMSWIKHVRLEDNEYFDCITEFLEVELPSLETLIVSINAADDRLNSLHGRIFKTYRRSIMNKRLIRSFFTGSGG